MMLFLGRLITLPLLLPKPRGRTLLNLPMLLLEFLTLILMRRFVRRRRELAARTAMVYMLLCRIGQETRTGGMWRFVGVQGMPVRV
ncbi:hypothetical protein ANAPH2_01019 [Anaplasma phagocytophilum]|nr:hypothetical protein ANAPH2_01019 [Anaplasma phagocytophilum]